MEINITKNNFENEVIKSEIPVLIDFWANWCGPCNMLGPLIEEISNERNDIKIGKINVDSEEALAHEFGIMSIPTLILFKGDRIIDKISGFKTKDELNNFIDQNINK